VGQRQIGPGQWQIIADVNRITPRSQAVQYNYLRAAALCTAGFEIMSPTQLGPAGLQGGYTASLAVQCKTTTCIGKSSWCTQYHGACFSNQNTCEAYRADALAGCSEAYPPPPDCQGVYQPCQAYGQTTCAPSGCFFSPPSCWEVERRWGRDGNACQFCQ
jgi:hypothetical protein